MEPFYKNDTDAYFKLVTNGLKMLKINSEIIKNRLKYPRLYRSPPHRRRSQHKQQRCIASQAVVDKCLDNYDSGNIKCDDLFCVPATMSSFTVTQSE